MLRCLPFACLFFLACQNPAPKTIVQPAPAPVMPEGTAIPAVTFTDLNCWIEQDKFFVVGICNNESAQWQKIWLKMDPLTAAGQPVGFNGSAIFQVHSNALPPKGRSAFFAFWPLSAFNSRPDTCNISGAGSIAVVPGPILLAEDQSAVKMKTDQPDFTWLVNTNIHNPLELTASHPRLDLLLYGTDKRLWMSTVLNPEDPAGKKTLKLEREGPMKAGEKRNVGCTVSYDNLPERLRTVKIGKVEFLAFEERQ